MKVESVAKFILQTYGDMSPKRLQIVCYSVNCWHLVIYSKPIFEERFHTIGNFPVCQTLSKLFIGKNLASASYINGECENLSRQQKELIINVFRFYSYKSMHHFDITNANLDMRFKQCMQKGRNNNDDFIFANRRKSIYYSSKLQ